ncbi:unnamed protein product [Diplocarpon coronariae]|nr:ser/Thr protein phosphatase superfamily [Diplocarpon mali]
MTSSRSFRQLHTLRLTVILGSIKEPEYLTFTELQILKVSKFRVVFVALARIDTIWAHDHYSGLSIIFRNFGSAVRSCHFGLSDFYYIEDWTIAKHNDYFTKDVAWLSSQVDQIAEQEPKHNIIILTHYSPTTDLRSIGLAHS